MGREREIEAGELESRELGSREMEKDIDSGIGLDSCSSSLLLPVKEEEEQQSWTTVQPTPILRSSSRAASLNSTKARGAVKKSISFSDGHGKSSRRRLRSHESQPSKQQTSTAPRIIVSTWDSLGGGRQKAQNYSSMRAAPEMKLWSIDHTSSWPRVRSPPEKVQVAGWWGPPSDSVSPQLGTIYNIVFAQVKEAAPDLSCLTMDLLFNPATNSLHTRIEALSASNFGRILSDLSILLFPTWPSMNLQSHAEFQISHIIDNSHIGRPTPPSSYAP